MKPTCGRGKVIKEDAVVNVKSNHTGHGFKKGDDVVVIDIIETEGAVEEYSKKITIPRSPYLLYCTSHHGDWWMCPTDVEA